MTEANTRSNLRDTFRKLGEGTAHAVGTPIAFLLALATVIVWALSGSYFKFSDTWQLVINTGTTIVTFLVVFLIQNTQNRDTRIMNLTLDELLRAVKGARTAFVGLNDILERFADIVGLFGGTFDDPNWFDRNSATCRQIFTQSAQEGVVLPAGVDTFEEHARQLDGTSKQPVVLAHATMVTRRR